MSLSDNNYNRKNYFVLKALFLFLLLFVSVNFFELQLMWKNSNKISRDDPPAYKTKEVTISPKSNSGQSLHSRIFQHSYTQSANISGRSPDELSIGFSENALIHGFLISVDCWKDTRLVEFMAGINQKPAYDTKSDKDVFFHVSFATNNTAGKIDEHIFLPQPLLVTPEDRLNVGAWIQNVSSKETTVSPEMIVYYSFAKK